MFRANWFDEYLETERRGRQTERQTDRQAGRQTDRKTETERQR